MSPVSIERSCHTMGLLATINFSTPFKHVKHTVFFGVVGGGHVNISAEIEARG